jgi:hypothetical protein
MDNLSDPRLKGRVQDIADEVFRVLQITAARWGVEFAEPDMQIALDQTDAGEAFKGACADALVSILNQEGK